MIHLALTIALGVVALAFLPRALVRDFLLFFVFFSVVQWLCSFSKKPGS